MTEGSLALLASRIERWSRCHGIAGVLYLALVVASFYPQSLRPRDTVAYIGDSLFCVYVVGWMNQQILVDPLHWYDANILFPNQRTLTLGDHQFLPSLVVGPVFWATSNPVLAYNVSVAIACLLAAFALRYLAMRLGIDPIGAWAAGALYAFHTYQVNEAPRLMLLYHGFIPLALAELVALLQTGATKHVWRLALVMLLQALCSNYHLAYGSFLVGLVTLTFLVAKPAKTLRKLPSLAAASAIAALLYFPVILPYIRNAIDYGYSRALPSGVDLAHYVSTTPTNVWYGAMGAEVRLQQQGPHFLGFVALGCALLALGAWAFRRIPESKNALLRASIWVPISAVLAVLFIALSLGKDIVVSGETIGPGPYRVLFNYVPGFQLLRVPERLGLIAMLFLGLLVGMALTLLNRGGFRRLALLVAVMVPLEHLSPLPVTDRIPVGRDIPAVYEWLKRDEARAVAEVPIHGEALIRKDTLEMYFSTRHLKPIIHGYTSYPPMMTTVLRRLAEQFPDDVSLTGFSKAGVDTVVVHRGRPHGEAIYGKLQDQVAAGFLERVARFTGEAARVYEGTADEVYRIVLAPELSAAPLPKGRRFRDPLWNYRTKAGDPFAAIDGDLSTAWEVRGPLAGDEFFEVTFDEPVRVSGVLLRLRQDSMFPTRFKIGARRPDGQWVPLAFYDAAHQLQLLERLLADPLDPQLGFDWSDQEITGIIVMFDDGGHSALGWSIPEIEVLVPEH